MNQMTLRSLVSKFVACLLVAGGLLFAVLPATHAQAKEYEGLDGVALPRLPDIITRD